ncbi:MAG TPA: glutamate--cysteine ligase [Jatrophihabitans sp.]|nr:glutamate--cysteine ligase [Jatrophihabitans sp.]
MNERTVGVEEEFLLLRRAGTELAARGEAVVDAANDADEDAQFEHELKRAQAELASAPTDSLASLAADLSTLRGELAQAGATHGVRLVPSGTSPVLGTAPTTASHRYHEMTERFGVVARQQVTCGMHIHVSVDTEAEGVHVLNGVGAWLPVLTALSTNSPFHGGQDTGYASYRSILWGQWPSAGPTAPFADHASYERLCEDLVATGAARDLGMMYFDARLSARYPTVELRICDVCPRVEDAVAIAGLARALVHSAAGSKPAPVRAELRRAAAWRAHRWGMTGELVDIRSSDGRPELVPAWELVDRLLEWVAPALDGAGDTTTVRNALSAIRRRGTGATLQRSVYAESGDFAAVVEALAVDAHRS